VPTVIVPKESIDKLILCTEGTASRAGFDRFFEELRPEMPELPFGEPDLALRRVYADGREEIGFSWSKVTAEDAARGLEAKGWRRDPNTGRFWLEGHPVVARLAWGALWWSGVRRGTSW
jgi:hypothetical protein